LNSWRWNAQLRGREARAPQYARIIAEETAKWRTVIARAGIKVD